MADEITDKLIIQVGEVSVSFDTYSLEKLSNTTKTDLFISIKPEKANELKNISTNFDASRPIYSVKFTSGNTNIFLNTIITLPYTMKNGENPNCIIVYGIDSKGKTTIISNGTYNSTDKSVSFVSDVNSTYAIGYNPKFFTDVPSSFWGKSAIEFAAARGLLNGMGNGVYEPNRSVTNAEFIQMIWNMLKTPIVSMNPNLENVNQDSWYYNAITSLNEAGSLKYKKYKRQKDDIYS